MPLPHSLSLLILVSAVMLAGELPHQAVVAAEDFSNTPANTWSEIPAGSVGPRESPALVWSKERRRFVMIGGTISHAHKPPFPYDVLSLDLSVGQWENELPPGGETWGGQTGPVNPPNFKSPCFELQDVAGNLRPWQRHAHMWYCGRVAPWNGKVYTLLCGRTLSYDPERRTWMNHLPKTSPTPETKSTREGLNWSAMCADPVNREFVLFGGCGVNTLRADPGTWVYATEHNEWRQPASQSQPLPRALSPMVYDPATKSIVLFGGEGLDTLFADTWVYDCATRTWTEKRPAVSPSPRFGHALLSLPKSGKIVLLGGVGYTSFIDYQARLYRPLPYEMWTYDVAANEWSLVKHYDEGMPTHHCVAAAVAASDDADHVVWWGPKTNGNPYDKESRTWVCRVDPLEIDREGTAKLGVPAGTVTHRTGSYDPAWYETDVPAADVKAQSEFYRTLPANHWTPLTAPKWPVNRQGGGWSTVAFDTDRQQLLHLGGGHSSYFGNDVAHFDTAASRWSISHRPQFALDFNYDLSGPGPWAFNGGPWGNHNYHAYAYDPARRRLIYLRNEYTHLYDPTRRRWLAEERLANNPFNGIKYTSYAVSTPAGVVVWALRKENQFVSGVWKLGPHGWTELATTGEKLPVPVTDGSTITFDSQRNRLLLTTSLGEKGIAHSGQIWACDLNSGLVSRLNPAGQERIVVKRFARESAYLPQRDLVLIGSHLAERNRLTFYDAAGNRWMTANVPGSEFFYRAEAASSVDLGLHYDSSLDLVWGVMCKLHPGAVQVLRVDGNLTLEPCQSP